MRTWLGDPAQPHYRYPGVMGSATLIPVSEYLSSSYDPDREYVEGRILERNVGEGDHSELQMAIAGYLYERRARLGIHVYPEQRVQVATNRFHVPDVCVVAGAKPKDLIFRSPPLICIEILSKDDNMLDVQQKVDDYLSFGVPHVWLLHPRNRKAYICTSEGMLEAKDGFLRVTEPQIEVPLAEIFRALD